MLKPTSTYKMSKSLKTSLALSSLQDPHVKGAWKRAMIDAELCSKIVPKSVKQDRRPKLLTGYVAVDGSTTE